MVLTFNEFIIQLNYYEVFGNSPVKGKEKKNHIKFLILEKLIIALSHNGKFRPWGSLGFLANYFQEVG